MRIGLVIYGNLETVTGGFIYDRRLVTYLSDTGDEVHILSLPWRNTARHLLYNLSSEFIRRIVELRLDILLEDELNHPSCLSLNQRLKYEEQCHVISIVHHLRMDEKQSGVQLLNNWVEKKYLSTVDGFIFNSQATAASVARFSNERPSVIAYPGKDRYSPGMTKKEIAKRSRQKGPLGIVFLGNVTPRKGLHTLIHALRYLPREQWRLTVIGSTERNKKYSRRIKEQMMKSEMSGNIRYTGEQSAAEVARHLRDNHVLVVPSRYEGYGLVYVEGMGFGLPAIGANAGGANEIIDQDVNGFLIPPDDAAALTGHLGLLISDRKKLQRMSINALRKYQQLPRWQDTTHRIRSFLCAILQTRHK